jgi:hypothetical protein
MNGFRSSPWLLPAALALFSLVAVAAIELEPAAQGPVAAVFPPWWSGPRAMLAAASAGPVVRLGALPFIVVTLPAAGGGFARLRRQGAWLLLNPQAVGGCGGRTINTASLATGN